MSDAYTDSLRPQKGRTCLHGACLVLMSSMTSVKCWGSNVYGQLGDGTFTDRASPTDVISLGGKLITQLVVCEIHTCVLFVDGTVKCWGSNIAGVVGTGGVDTSGVPYPLSIPTD